jgi:hypothetical protein
MTVEGETFHGGGRFFWKRDEVDYRVMESVHPRQRMGQVINLRLTDGCIRPF